jgi:hypothetical protein
VTRVSGGNVPLPVAASLEAEVDVSVPRVIAAVRGVLGASRPPGAGQPSASQNSVSQFSASQQKG